MINIEDAVTAPEAAYVLRSMLGPMRSWSDFLADVIRNKADIDGLTLQPCCRLHDGRALRPHYARSDIMAFIREVRAIYPDAMPTPVKSTRLEIDDGVYWRHQKFDKHGSPFPY